eukprot:m.60073 g.60073  ORF g.60073 m.60073 type:complete len:632 (-) comp22796_c0_seq1:215-2110(-)
MSGQPKRRFDDVGGNVPPAAKRFQAAPGPGTVAQSLQQQQIQAMLENTKRQIALRKAQMASGGVSLMAPPTIPTAQYGVPPAPPPHAMQQRSVGAVMQPGVMPVGVMPPPRPPPSSGLAPGFSNLQASVAARLAAFRQSQGAGVGPPPPPPPGLVAPGMQGIATPNPMMMQGIATPNPMMMPGMPNEMMPQASPKAKTGPQSLVLIDGKAKFVDSSGKVIEMVARAAEFVANREGEGAATEETEDPNFDDRVSQKIPTERKKRSGFAFHNQGDFVALASKKRAQAQLEKLQEEIAKASKRTGISSATKLALIAPFKNDTEDLVVPDFEWWDRPLLRVHGQNSYTFLDGNMADEKKFPSITHLIQHPILVQPPAEGAAAPPIKIMLTKKERKKIRSQRRKAEEKEKQEQIRLGLMDAPAPKVSKNNFMSVLTSDAVADPTRVEAIVAKQMAMRQRKHNEANDERSLSKEEKKERKIVKLKETAATENQIKIAVFRVNDLSDGKNKYKVNENAKQLYLTGVCLMSKPEANLLNLVVVEGGPKGIKNYKKLMMSRIKWSIDDDESSDEEDGDEPKKVKNKCTLVWEGTAEKRAFSKFESKMARSEEWARELFNMHGVPQYWDMAYSDLIVEQTQ